MKQITLRVLFIGICVLGFVACNIVNSSSSDSSEENHLIANIPEASGISYCSNTDTLIVVSDEGSYYEINSQGDILSTHELGDYDFEGVVCEDDILMLAVEGEGLLRVDRESLDTKFFELKGDGYKITDKHGIEGLTKIKKRYYLSIQAKNEEDSKLLVVKLDGDCAEVKRVIDHGIIDSSGLTYENKKLYIVSDTNDALYIYNIKTKEIEQEIELPEFAQEGVAFDEDNNIYFADDDGAVMKYSLDELGL